MSEEEGARKSELNCGFGGNKGGVFDGDCNEYDMLPAPMSLSNRSELRSSM